jgi:hypothetical protein
MTMRAVIQSCLGLQIVQGVALGWGATNDAFELAEFVLENDGIGGASNDSSIEGGKVLVDTALHIADAHTCLSHSACTHGQKSCCFLTPFCAAFVTLSVL